MLLTCLARLFFAICGSTRNMEGVEGVWVMYGLTSNDRAWTVEAMGHPTVLSGPAPGTANQSYAISSKFQQPASSLAPAS